MRVFFIILLMLLTSCSSDALPSGKRSQAFQYTGSDKQEEILAILKDRNIPYEINRNGNVVYLLKDQAEVHGIIRVVRYGENLNENIYESFVLTNEYVRERYENSFHEAGVPYDISTHENVTQINWSQKYGPKVDLIRQKLDEEILDYYLDKSK